MTRPIRDSADPDGRSRRLDDVSRAVLPLWIAALSLAVIAAVMIISSVELIHAIRSTQTSVVQLSSRSPSSSPGSAGFSAASGPTSKTAMSELTEPNPRFAPCLCSLGPDMPARHHTST